MENKINNKNDILIYVDSKKKDIEKRLIKRQNFNRDLFKKFKKIQLNSIYKKRNSNFIIKNDFKKKSIEKNIRKILKQIL